MISNNQNEHNLMINIRSLFDYPKDRNPHTFLKYPTLLDKGYNKTHFWKQDLFTILDLKSKVLFRKQDKLHLLWSIAQKLAKTKFVIRRLWKWSRLKQCLKQLLRKLQRAYRH